MTKIISMPSLSPTMAEGVLQSWEKEVGTEVFSGGRICSNRDRQSSCGV